MTGDADGAIGADGYLYALNLPYENAPEQPTNPAVLVYASLDGVRWQGPATFPLPTVPISRIARGSLPTPTFRAAST